MSGAGSVTIWLDRLKAGDRGEAVTRLWERFFEQLVTRARDHLRGRAGVTEGEDAALSAFNGFVQGVTAGRFPRLNDRDNLWQILLMLVARKSSNVARDAIRLKRGGGYAMKTIGGGLDSEGSQLAVPDPAPGPDEELILLEEFERLLSTLGDPQLRQVALWALEGYTNAEIGERMGRSVATVERKLKRIRELLTGQSYR